MHDISSDYGTSLSTRICAAAIDKISKTGITRVLVNTANVLSALLPLKLMSKTREINISPDNVTFGVRPDNIVNTEGPLPGTSFSNIAGNDTILHKEDLPSLHSENNKEGSYQGKNAAAETPQAETPQKESNVFFSEEYVQLLSEIKFDAGQMIQLARLSDKQRKFLLDIVDTFSAEKFNATQLLEIATLPAGSPSVLLKNSDRFLRAGFDAKQLVEIAKLREVNQHRLTSFLDAFLDASFDTGEILQLVGLPEFQLHFLLDNFFKILNANFNAVQMILLANLPESQRCFVLRHLCQLRKEKFEAAHILQLARLEEYQQQFLLKNLDRFLQAKFSALQLIRIGRLTDPQQRFLLLYLDVCLQTKFTAEQIAEFSEVLLGSGNNLLLSHHRLLKSINNLYANEFNAGKLIKLARLPDDLLNTMLNKYQQWLKKGYSPEQIMEYSALNTEQQRSWRNLLHRKRLIVKATAACLAISVLSYYLIEDYKVMRLMSFLNRIATS